MAIFTNNPMVLIFEILKKLIVIQPYQNIEQIVFMETVLEIKHWTLLNRYPFEKALFKGAVSMNRGTVSFK